MYLGLAKNEVLPAMPLQVDKIIWFHFYVVPKNILTQLIDAYLIFSLRLVCLWGSPSPQPCLVEQSLLFTKTTTIIPMIHTNMATMAMVLQRTTSTVLW